MLSKKFPYRDEAISLLKLFAYPEELLRWQSEIWVYARDELICSWSDIYFPAQDPSGYNPGVWERGQREWDECFREPEIAAMARFNRALSNMPAFLFAGWIDITDLVAHPEWERLAKAAQDALLSFGETSEDHPA